MVMAKRQSLVGVTLRSRVDFSREQFLMFVLSCWPQLV
jgi:hypothetical protein